MKRRALIIGSPLNKSDGENYLPGVEVDLRSYQEFLMSPLGGSWTKAEVVALRNPTNAQIQVELNALRSVDYSFVLFGGHGYFDKGKSTTMIDINAYTSIDSKDLRAGARTHTLVIDCCRKVANIVLKALAEELREIQRLDPAACRRLFDEGLAAASGALTVLWGCSIGEGAGDDSANGGYYSGGLLEVAADWAKGQSPTRPAMLSIVSVHDGAVPRVIQHSGGRQNPTIEKGRSGPYPPFAVVA